MRGQWSYEAGWAALTATAKSNTETGDDISLGYLSNLKERAYSQMAAVKDPLQP